MKTFLATAVLIGLTGTALVAAPAAPAPEALDLSALPMELQEKITSAQKAAEANPPSIEADIDAYLSQQYALVAGYNTWLKNLPPYLYQNANALAQINLIKSAITLINSTLKRISNTNTLITNVSIDNAAIETTKELIHYNYKYPMACANLQSNYIGCIMNTPHKVTGYVVAEPFEGQCSSEPKTTFTISPDVGQIGTGGDVALSTTPTPISVYKDPKTNVVYCVESPTAKK